MIPYRAPDDLATVNQGVMLFRVNFEQSLPDALYSVGMALVAIDAIADAERAFDILIAKFPQISQPWLRKGEIMFRRHNWDEALAHLLKGISLAAEKERPALFSGTAHLFYTQGNHTLAIEIYRRALAEGPNPDASCYLAWILATSREDRLRDGKEALSLAQVALKSDPNSPTYLNSWAAALAENGRFPEAIAAAEKALANGRVQGQAGTITASEQNLVVLRTGAPIRR
jgi:tetratricopeptide (TPR) repeat protein